jgi:hypothetical protein
MRTIWRSDPWTRETENGPSHPSRLARAAGENERSKVKVIGGPYAAIADPDHSEETVLDEGSAATTTLSMPERKTVQELNYRSCRHIECTPLHRSAPPRMPKGCLSNNRRHLASYSVVHIS